MTREAKRESSLFLVEETRATVTIARVVDRAKLLDERSRRIHGDVIDALVDLVVALEEESADDEGENR
ncbi:MAG: hypothetical protein JWO36_2016 [Myxococcales bacterium]|nr:hypothetical protein [Myxococcales bacterium]